MFKSEHLHDMWIFSRMCKNTHCFDHCSLQATAQESLTRVFNIALARLLADLLFANFTATSSHPLSLMVTAEVLLLNEEILETEDLGRHLTIVHCKPLHKRKAIPVDTRHVGIAWRFVALYDMFFA